MKSGSQRGPCIIKQDFRGLLDLTNESFYYEVCIFLQVQTERAKIWVIGSTGHSADKEILWSDEFPNFSDFDVLIINTQTLTPSIMNLHDYGDFGRAEDLIFDRLWHGGIVVCLTSELTRGKSESTLPVNNYILSPIQADTVKTKPAQFLDFNESSFLSAYYRSIKEWSIYLDGLRLRNSEIRASRLDAKYLYVISLQDSELKSKGGHIIGGGYKIRFLSEGRGIQMHDIFSQGIQYFLPPIKENAEKESIDLLISILKPSKQIRENAPSWEASIDLPDLDELNKKIQENQMLVKKLNDGIVNLTGTKTDLEHYRQLLWAKNEMLEDVVRDCLVLLGFPEIRKIREENLEDWVFEFKNISDYVYGVIEVKGSDKRTSLADLTQCNKWVEDYLIDKKKVKGVFISNQSRLQPYPSSRIGKEKFEPNEIEYATSRDICILPSHVLFHAVVNTLATKKLDRKKMEEKIAWTKGLLNSIE